MTLLTKRKTWSIVHSGDILKKPTAKSTEPSRARAKPKRSASSAAKPKSPRKPKSGADKPKHPDGLGAPDISSVKRMRGRPKDTPDLWTPEYIAAVAEDMLDYAEASDYPTEAEYCYTRGIHFQRLCEFPELKAAKEMIFAKRQAMTIRRGILLGQGEGALGSFLMKLAANAGPFSLTDKQELAHSGSLGVTIVDDVG